MNEQEIVALYTEQCWTLRRIADQFDTNHHMIKRILLRHDVEITQKGRVRKPFTDEHRRKIADTSRGRRAWNKGKTMSDAARRINMAAKLKTDIDLDKYPDFDKLKFLTHFLSKHKSHIGCTDELRQAFLDTFYFDPRFDELYNQWMEHEQNPWYRPTLDHIEPKSKGGSWSLDNLQFLTWFENRAKADMSNSEWQSFKRSTHTQSDLFEQVG